MYEDTGLYYALFGPQAELTDAERAFLSHMLEGKTRALDFGSGLGGQAQYIAEQGLDVVAIEPSPTLGLLAADQMGRRPTQASRRITLLRSALAQVEPSIDADFALARSVFMLLNDPERDAALQSISRHLSPGARLLIDFRSDKLDWPERERVERSQIGATQVVRKTSYNREQNGIRVGWTIDEVALGTSRRTAAEKFFVRFDKLESIFELLAKHDFEPVAHFGGYDLAQKNSASSETIVVEARRLL